MKLRARSSFIQQIGKDAKEVVPEILSRPRLFPTLEEVKKSDARQLAERKEKEAASNAKTAATKGKKSTPTDNPQWLDRITKKMKAKKKESKAKAKAAGKVTKGSGKGLCQVAYSTPEILALPPSL